MKYCRFVSGSDELYHHGILHMKWGVRRFQNEDGTLTELGKSRLKSQRDAEIDKHPDKYNTQANIDALDNRYRQIASDRDRVARNANKWVTEDLGNVKKGIDAGSQIMKNLSQLERDSAPKAERKRMNLDNMTDQELRERINREMLEKQYNDLFSKPVQPKVSKGRAFTRSALEVGGAVLGTASTVVGLALAIRELRNH